jgi:hypothetical protein
MANVLEEAEYSIEYHYLKKNRQMAKSRRKRRIKETLLGGEVLGSAR